MSTTIRWVKLSEGGEVPRHSHAGDAGYDLVVSRDTVIPPHTFVDVHTDIAVIWPDGMWGRITGRSSTLRKKGLLVSEGIIDNEYTGELFTGVYNLGDQEVVIKKGERVAQLIPHMLIGLEWTEIQAEEIPDTKRGSGGFGSTGK